MHSLCAFSPVYSTAGASAVDLHPISVSSIEAIGHTYCDEFASRDTPTCPPAEEAKTLYFLSCPITTTNPTT